MKEKGAAAEITDDAGKLKNYMEKKPKKAKKTKKTKPKKKKQSTDGADDFKKVRALTKDAPDRDKSSQDEET